MKHLTAIVLALCAAFPFISRASIADQLLQLERTRVAITNAIVEKGGVASGALTNVPNEILSIKTKATNDVYVTVVTNMEVITLEYVTNSITYNFNEYVALNQMAFDLGQYNQKNISIRVLFKPIQYVNDGHIFGNDIGSSFVHFTMFNGLWYFGWSGEYSFGDSYEDLDNVHMFEWNINRFGIHSYIYDNGILDTINSPSSLEVGLYIGLRDYNANLCGTRIYMFEILDFDTMQVLKRYRSIDGVFKDEISGSIPSTYGYGDIQYGTESVQYTISQISQVVVTNIIEAPVSGFVKMEFDGSEIKVVHEEE